jgi:hypothetical protein
MARGRDACRAVLPASVPSLIAAPARTSRAFTPSLLSGQRFAEVQRRAPGHLRTRSGPRRGHTTLPVEGPAQHHARSSSSTLPRAEQRSPPVEHGREPCGRVRSATCQHIRDSPRLGAQHCPHARAGQPSWLTAAVRRDRQWPLLHTVAGGRDAALTRSPCDGDARGGSCRGPERPHGGVGGGD